MALVFAAALPTVAVVHTALRFPVHRIYCVGRNYAEHAREMGSDPQREPPFFFAKPADAVVENRATLAFPSRTHNLHYEAELVVALKSGGTEIAAAQALDHVFGYAVGIDLTRRDLQKQAREAGKPWDTSKGFDASAPLTAIHPAVTAGQVLDAPIWLTVNGKRKQNANTADMIWSVPEIIAELSTYYELRAGDLIFTGTPAGVGPIKPGDRIEAGIGGLETLSISF